MLRLIILAAIILIALEEDKPDGSSNEQRESNEEGPRFHAHFENAEIGYEIKASENERSSRVWIRDEAMCSAEMTGIIGIRAPHDILGPAVIVVLRRSDGSVQFNRNWHEYSEGFGELQGEFFLGLEKLHRLSKSHRLELFIYLEDLMIDSAYAHYTNFKIDSRKNSYALTSLGDYRGTAGDALRGSLNAPFTTDEMSGWWSLPKGTASSNLNAPYTINDVDSGELGILWSTWPSAGISFVEVQIKPTL